jgi:CBS domain containing-hemolysin-like protein
MTESPQLVGVLTFLALVVINGLFVIAASSLINARKQQLRTLADEGNKLAGRALDLSTNSTRLLASRQFMSLLLHICAAGVLTAYVAVPTAAQWSANGADINIAREVVYLLTWLIGTLIMLTFGELIPDSISSANPEKLAMSLLIPITILLTITAPFTRLIMWVSSRLAAPFGKRGMSYVTEEEIKTLVDAGQEEGVIEDEEKEMIYSIFQFGDKVVREIMIPRIDVTALEANTPSRKAVELSLATGHSRMPIYEETIDKVIGLLYARDLLKMFGSGQNFDEPVRTVMRPAYYIPESKKAGDLLAELQERKIHMAIVIDEYGGTAGLITIEDLLEEIVGDIQDEYDPDEEAEYQKITDDEYLFDAGINLDDVNRLLESELPTNESDTLGGLVFSTLGKVPLLGETFQLDNLEIKVENITGRRIRKVRVTRLPPPVPEVEESDSKTFKVVRDPDAKPAESPSPTATQTTAAVSTNDDKSER